MLSSTSDSTESCDSNSTWKEKFLSKNENKGLLNVPDAYILDKFNLIGIGKYIDNIERCYEVITDKKQSKNVIEESSLYSMIHQRYILTDAGMERMYNRILKTYYGECRRMGCEDIPLIPMGLSNIPCVSSVKLYCYNCNNVFDPERYFIDLDGCSFGNTFPNLLYISYKHNLRKKYFDPYVPRIFGFQIYNQKENKEQNNNGVKK